MVAELHDLIQGLSAGRFHGAPGMTEPPALPGFEVCYTAAMVERAAVESPVTCKRRNLFVDAAVGDGA